ncbi:MAG: hypothetical protein GXP45_00175 [bacterium]|nr:hypothetical protein [bacterium]
MKKNVFAMLIALGLVVSLAGCSLKDTDDTNNATGTDTTVTEEVVTGTTQVDEKTADESGLSNEEVATERTGDEAEAVDENVAPERTSAE